MARLTPPPNPIACHSSISPLVTSTRFAVRCLPRAQIGPRILASVSVSTTPHPHQQQPSTGIGASGKDGTWKVFAEHVSGEWDGYGAEFSSSGDPRELPCGVVPEAFKEWDVQIHDWQTQCPTVANVSLHYKLIRLLPTVGCEADAATQYSVDDRQAADLHSGTDFLAFHASGSYIAVWPGRRVLRERFGTGNPSKTYVCEGDKQGAFEIEHCLVQEGQPKFRVRILQQVVMQSSNENSRSFPVIKNITVQREKWESEFRNGELLGGCGTSGSAFAMTPTLQGSELLGVWLCDKFSAQSELYLAGIHQLVYMGSDNERRELSKNMLPLPKGLWSEMTELEDGHFSVAAGWLVNSDIAITSNCEFSSIGNTQRAWMKFKRRKG